MSALSSSLGKCRASQNTEIRKKSRNTKEHYTVKYRSYIGVWRIIRNKVFFNCFLSLKENSMNQTSLHPNRLKNVTGGRWRQRNSKKQPHLLTFLLQLNNGVIFTWKCKREHSRIQITKFQIRPICRPL